MLTLLWHDSEVYAHENIKTKSWERERERERWRYCCLFATIYINYMIEIESTV